MGKAAEFWHWITLRSGWQNMGPPVPAVIEKPTKGKRGKKDARPPSFPCMHCKTPQGARGGLCIECKDNAIALGTLLATAINLQSEAYKARQHVTIAEWDLHRTMPRRNAMPMTDVRLYDQEGPASFHLVFYGMPAQQVRNHRIGTVDDEVYWALERRGIARTHYAHKSHIWERTRVDSEDALRVTTMLPGQHV
jgi:hypothetical protein